MLQRSIFRFSVIMLNIYWCWHLQFPHNIIQIQAEMLKNACILHCKLCLNWAFFAFCKYVKRAQGGPPRGPALMQLIHNVKFCSIIIMSFCNQESLVTFNQWRHEPSIFGKEMILVSSHVMNNSNYKLVESQTKIAWLKYGIRRKLQISFKGNTRQLLVKNSTSI